MDECGGRGTTLRPNDQARIQAGPFAGAVVTVVRITDPERAIVRIRLRNRQSLLELDCDMLIGDDPPDPVKV